MSKFIWQDELYQFVSSGHVWSHLNMEDITDADYTLAKRIGKDFEIKVEENVMICMFKGIQYCWLMYLRNLEICALKYMNLILQNFFQLIYYHGKHL